MHIQIKNKIDIDGEIELVHEVHEADLTVKGDYHYLIYQNGEGEKVVIKFNDQTLVMTRFSTPQSVMRFEKSNFAPCSIPSPMGVQKIVSKTMRYHLANQNLSLSYSLLPYSEAEHAFASYELQITWG